MLATCTGANSGASWTTTRPPFCRSITINSSGLIVRHAAAGAAATMSPGVIFFWACAVPAISSAAESINKDRIIFPLGNQP